MNLSTQLRIILLLAGAAIWLAIYLWGKRKAAAAPQRMIVMPEAETAAMEAVSDFAPVDELDEDEFDTPAYMRRHGQREMRQDYEPRIANAHDYVDMDEVRDADRRFVDIPVHDIRADDGHDAVVEFAEPAVDTIAPQTPSYAEPVYREAVYAEPVDEQPDNNHALVADAPLFDNRREPSVSLDEEFAVTAVNEPALNADEMAGFSEPVHYSEPEPPTIPAIPVVKEPVAATSHMAARPAERSSDSVPATTPTLSDVVHKPAEPVPASRVSAHADHQPIAASATASKPAGAAAARRKIIALRLPMPERVPGSRLLPLLQGEHLQHGKFSIFHRMQESGTVFSVASMVEPGTFDPISMAEQQFPGVTLFMLLPGPLDGLVAYDQMLSCAQRLAHATGGVLQDERGSKLTAHVMERLREEVLDFQHLLGNAPVATA